MPVVIFTLKIWYFALQILLKRMENRRKFNLETTEDSWQVFEALFIWTENSSSSQYPGCTKENRWNAHDCQLTAWSPIRKSTAEIRSSFQDLSKSACMPLYEALVRPHLKYGMPACSRNLVADINHLEQIQILSTRLVTGMCRLPYEERLQRWRLQADLITAFTILKGLLDIDPNSFFLPPARRGLRGHSF